MEEVLHANIFFFIASVATIVFCILVCVAFYHVIKILKLIRTIMERIEAGSEVIAEDVSNVRSAIVNGGIIARIFQFVTGASGRRRRSRDDED